MADPVTGLAVAGVGVSVISSVMSGNAKAQAAHLEAANKRIQADEVLKAGQREQDLLRIRGEKVTGGAENAIAQSGQNVSGSSLLQLEDIAHQINSESLALDHASQFRSNQLRISANSEDQQGDSYSTAGWLDAGSSVLGGAAKTYSLVDPNDKSTRTVGSDSAMTPSKSLKMRGVL